MTTHKQPVCPACGAKFSHDTVKMECRKCGLPDEIMAAGGQAIARWKRKPVRREISVSESGLVSTTVIADPLSKRARKLARKSGHKRGRIKQGHVLGHGRQHA